MADLRPKGLAKALGQDLKLERPDLGSWRPERPERPERPRRPDLKPERPDMRPKRPDLRPGRPNLRPYLEGEDKQTDRRTKVPVFYRDRCPKSFV